MAGASTPFAAPFFNEFVVKVPGDAGELLAALEGEKIVGGLNLERFYPEFKNHLLICVTEVVSKDSIDHMASIYQEAGVRLEPARTAHSTRR